MFLLCLCLYYVPSINSHIPLVQTFFLSIKLGIVTYSLMRDYFDSVVQA